MIIDSKLSTDPLLKVLNDSQSRHLNLVDTVKAFQKYRSNWSDVPPEVRDVLLLKVILSSDLLFVLT
jgi:hypothetical protein